MASGKLRSTVEVIRRKKIYLPEDGDNLKRCLNIWELAALGSGSTMGVGVYVLVGAVAVGVAGPAVVLSFLVAALVALLAGLCYAELGSRLPMAGATYAYTYATVGEFAAFLVGWCNIFEGVFGTASLARGLGTLVDITTNHTMSEWFESVAPIRADFLSTYFDLFSFLIVIVLGAVMAVGVRESMFVNSILTIVNLCVVAFIIFVGAFKADAANWSIPGSEVPAAGYGVGGFFPYGVAGMLRGAAYCFYGFVGFDVISHAAEEAHQPRKVVPKAILVSLATLCLCYVAVSIVVTMMAPYYMQDVIGGVGTAFSAVGWQWGVWIVLVGAVCGLSSCIFGAMYAASRLLYAMAEDGLMFSGFCKLSGRRSPVVATMAVTCVVAVLAGICKLEQLVLFVSVGTLLSYTVVAACVIILRYRSDEEPTKNPSYLRQIFGCGRTASTHSSRIAVVCFLLFVCVCCVLGGVPTAAWNEARAGGVAGVALLLLLAMALQPHSTLHTPVFKTPLVPLVPALSAACNVYLLLQLAGQTWARVAIWMLLGILLYISWLCMCMKNKNTDHLEGNINQAFGHSETSGKLQIHIVVEEPTPPSTRRSVEHNSVEHDTNLNDSLSEQLKDDIKVFKPHVLTENEKTASANVTMSSYTVETIEHNEEKEAKIIDLLDQVLQAEEDSYGEILSMSDEKYAEQGIVSTVPEPIPQRKSLGELSEAGSEASLPSPGLAQYDVVAQVHREDLPKLEEENNDEENENNKSEVEGHRVIFYNDSETASGTDESGYSDTTDRNNFIGSTEELKEEPEPYIPPPPPLIEALFASPFKKSYTMSAKPKPKPVEEEKPRESVQSNNSVGDDTIVFGSAKQMSFADKLSNMLMKKIPTNSPMERKRSNSAGNIAEAAEPKIPERPSMFIDLNKEIRARGESPSLRPVKPLEVENPSQKNIKGDSDEEDADDTMNKQDLKSKLESIFATGGAQLMKPRLMKSNPPTPEESGITESAAAKVAAKVDKSDTLKLQKAKFSEVLNSFRLSFNKDDAV